jgi:hypothetical protein
VGQLNKPVQLRHHVHKEVLLGLIALAWNACAA